VVTWKSVSDLFSGLRIRLTLLIALVIVVTFGTTLYNLRREREQAVREAEEGARATVRVADAEYQRLVAGAEQLMVGLTELPAIRANDGTACSAYFTELGRHFPQYSSLGAARPDGTVFCSSLPIDRPVRLGDRPSFQLALASRTTFMGPVVTGRLSKKRVVTFFRASVDARDAVRAVTYLGLDLAYLGTHAAQTTLPPGGDLNILDGTGTVLARHPAMPEWIGRSAAEEALFGALAAGSDDTLQVAQGLDGVSRRYAFVRVKGAPPPGIILAAGIPTERAVAAVDSAWQRQLWVFALVSAGALAIGWWGAEMWVRRPVSRLLGATRAIARGDLAARSGLRRGHGELGMLARAFDTMAEALQARTAALAEATATLETRVRERTADLEEASRRAQAQLDFIATVLDTEDSLVLVLDPDGRIVLVNRACEQTWGYRAEELHGSNVFERLVVPEDAERVRAAFERIASGGAAVPGMESRSVTRDGALRTIAWSAGVIRNARGAVDFVVATGIDLTEQRRAEERLRQAEKLTTLGELLSGVAHELNNPLAVVSGYAQIVAEVPDVPPAVRERLIRIDTQAQRAARIIRNLLTFARRRTPQRGRVALPQIMEHALDFVAYPVRANGITVTRPPAPDLPPITGDADEILQVFINILTNAVQALEQWEGRREIVVDFERRPTRIRVTIHNTGPDITPATASRIFEPFFTTKGPGAGTGLGLSICYGIVTSHGGDIAVTSAPGEGVTFAVELPPAVPEPDSSPSGAEDRGPAHPTGRRILVVDDEEPVLAFLGDALRSWDNVVTTARSGREALTLLQHSPAYDAIVLDLRMPDLDGRQFYRQLEAETPHLAARVVFATGDIVGVAGAAAVPGGRPILHKPFDLLALGETLALLTGAGHAVGPEVTDARATAADREGRPRMDPRPQQLGTVGKG
jgi:two-component system NtrC family sensor kinase